MFNVWCLWFIIIFVFIHFCSVQAVGVFNLRFGKVESPMKFCHLKIIRFKSHWHVLVYRSPIFQVLHCYGENQHFYILIEIIFLFPRIIKKNRVFIFNLVPIYRKCNIYTILPQSPRIEWAQIFRKVLKSDHSNNRRNFVFF